MSDLGPTVGDPHPIRSAWARYKTTPEFAERRLEHDEKALFAGFVDGWMYGRMRNLTVNPWRS